MSHHVGVSGVISLSPHSHNDLVDEDIITMARYVAVLSPIPCHFFTFVVIRLVFQYFLIARRAQLAILVRFTIHHDICDFTGLRVCDFPERVYLMDYAANRFCMAGFERDNGGGGTGAVFLGDIFVLLLELEGHNVMK